MFFYHRLKTGIDNIVKWARTLFGSKLELRLQRHWSLVSREFKLKYLGEDGFLQILAMPQDRHNAFTPIQLVPVSSIGNEEIGTCILIRKKVDSTGEVYNTEIHYRDTTLKINY